MLEKLFIIMIEQKINHNNLKQKKSYIFVCCVALVKKRKKNEKWASGKTKENEG